MNSIGRFQPTVHIASFNPYVARYPNLKVVSREGLHLIKRLRTNGIDVVVDPDDKRPLLYSTEKGFREFIADPVHAFLTGMPVGLMVNLASSWIMERLQRCRDANVSAPETHLDRAEIIVEISEDGRRLRYDHIGLPISDDRFYALLEAMERKAKGYQDATFTQPPYSRLPVPIFLDHTPQIVGWANVTFNNKALRCDPAKIDDEDTWNRIHSGEFKGLSIAVLVHDSECSICHFQYADCLHISGQEYDGTVCTVGIHGAHLAEISVVRDPVNPECVIDLGSLC